jgi:hypothetical protein
MAWWHGRATTAGRGKISVWLSRRVFCKYGSLAGLTHIWVFGVKFWVKFQKNKGM